MDTRDNIKPGVAVPLRQRTQSFTIEAWEDAAQGEIIRVMKERNLTYGDLERRLADMYVYESAAQLNRKINRKKFSAAFLLMCMRALGMEQLKVPSAKTGSRKASHAK